MHDLMEDMQTAVVIPTYNEAENIERLLKELLLLTDASFYIVDDASPDGTGGLVRAMQHPRILLIERPAKAGIGSAYREGFAAALAAGAQRVVQMDADFSHAVADIPLLLEHPADLVIGSRYIEGGEIVGWNLWRHFCSRAAMLAARNILRLPQRDVTSGFRAWSAPLLAAILTDNIQSNGYAFQEEMLFRAVKRGASIQEIPVTFVDRQAGASKLGYRDVLEFFSSLNRLRNDV